jgi:hypothetical protein
MAARRKVKSAQIENRNKSVGVDPERQQYYLETRWKERLDPQGVHTRDCYALIKAITIIF